MKLLKSLLLLMLCLSILSTCAFATTFSDVTNDYEWAASSIQKLSEQNIVNGYPDGTFRPEQNITRAEFAKLITMMFAPSEEVVYEDVSEQDWYYDYVSKSGRYFLFENTFSPNNNITRQEVAYALYIALEYTDAPMDRSIPFSDLEQVNDEYLPAVKTLAREGLLNGYPDGSFGPEKEITRAEIVTVLDRASNRQTTEEDAVTEEVKAEETENLKSNNYFFVVSRVSVATNQDNEPVTKVEGYQDGKLTTLILPENVTITTSSLATDSTVKAGDIISYYRNYHDEIRQVSIGLNINNLPRENRIELLTVGNTTKRHIAVGTVKEIFKEKAIELVSLAGDTEKLYEVNNPVYVYESKQNGKIVLSDFLEITDSTYEPGDTVIAFSYDDVLHEILVIKE